VLGATVTARILVGLSNHRGATETVTVTIPEGGLPIRVTVENASAQPLAGSYTLSLAPAS
jgi:hypothetical protein